MMRDRIKRIKWPRATYADPLYAGRHPFQTYFLVVCVLTGILRVFGTAAAGSVEETLPYWLAVAWDVALSGGSAVALVAVYWRGELATALTLERIGLAFVGIAAVIFALAVFVSGGLPRLFQALLILGFGIWVMLRRSVDIGRVMKAAIQVAKEPEK